MRCSVGYIDWVKVAEVRNSPSDRERAALTAARIRDNHSGSDVDQRELTRMERIVNREYEDWLPSQKVQTRIVSPKAIARKQAPLKLNIRARQRLIDECFGLGQQSAKADWEYDELLDNPQPNSADPTMLAYSEKYSTIYQALLNAWIDGYREQAHEIEASNHVDIARSLA